MKESIVILAGGGPAPGINTVISTVAKTFLKDGYRVLGLNEGYKNLFKPDPDVIEMDFLYADAILKQGGSALKMSRYKPKNEEFNTEFFVKNNPRPSTTTCPCLKAAPLLAIIQLKTLACIWCRPSTKMPVPAATGLWSPPWVARRVTWLSA